MSGPKLQRRSDQQAQMKSGWLGNGEEIGPRDWQRSGTDATDLVGEGGKVVAEDFKLYGLNTVTSRETKDRRVMVTTISLVDLEDIRERCT